MPKARPPIIGVEFPPWHCVYAVATSGLVKIGWTTNMAQRFTALNQGSPTPVRIVATMPGGRPLEAWLHQSFARSRVHGEWFRLSTAERNRLERLFSGADRIPAGQVDAIATRQASGSAKAARRRADQRFTGHAPSTGQAKYSKVRTYHVPPGPPKA